MTGALIEPNIHAVLIHFPLALLSIGIFIEVFSFFWPRSGARTAGRWMIALGILAAIPTITSGLYALRQTATTAGVTDDDTWDVVAAAANWSGAQWIAVEDHIRYVTAGAVMLLAGLVVWIASNDTARHRLYLLGVAMLLAGGGMIAFGAHHGGSLVYQFGTGVKMPAHLSAEVPTTVIGRLQSAISPLELHATLAGLAFALVAVSLGLSVRRSNIAWETQMEEQKAIAAGYRPAGQAGDGNTLSIPTLYPGWFWVLATLALAATVAVGLSLFGVWRPTELLAVLRTDRLNDDWRPVIHANLAATLVVLSILLGLILRFMPRRRFIMGVLSTLLVLAVLIQAWTGIQMLFDGPAGSLLHFTQKPANRTITVPNPAPITAPIAPTQPALPPAMPPAATKASVSFSPIATPKDL